MGHNQFIFALLIATLTVLPARAAEKLPPAKTALPPGAVLVPLCRQATDYTCGAAAMQSVLGYYGQDINEGELAKALKSNSQVGTRFEKIAELARRKGYKVAVHKNSTVQNLRSLLDQQLPVICLIQAWSEKPAKLYAGDWNNGHYVVAIAHDVDNIYFMDPSTLGHYTFIPVKEFEMRWHDKDAHQKLVHFAMTISKPKPKFDSSSVEYMP